jgi:transcriptional regulator with XRE-family HTH domain
VIDLPIIAEKIASRRKALALRQAELAARAHVSVATIKVLEQGRLAELGFAKIVRILAALGLELELREANLGRPTLEDLRSESDHD